MCYVTDSGISRGIFGLQDTAMEMSVREMKTRCRTTLGDKTFQVSYLSLFNPDDTATFRSQRVSFN